MSEKLVNEQAVIDVIDNFNVFESRGDQIALEIKIRELPSAEPQIIRCKDCRYYKQFGSEADNDTAYGGLMSAT